MHEAGPKAAIADGVRESVRDSDVCFDRCEVPACSRDGLAIRRDLGYCRHMKELVTRTQSKTEGTALLRPAETSSACSVKGDQTVPPCVVLLAVCTARGPAEKAPYAEVEKS